MYLYLHPATGAQWRGGARFFRCDVAAVGSEAGRLVPYTETLQGALRPGGPRSIGCANQVVEDKKIRDLVAVACTAPHDTELVGFARRPDVKTYPVDYKSVAAIFDPACDDCVGDEAGGADERGVRCDLGGGAAPAGDAM